MSEENWHPKHRTADENGTISALKWAAFWIAFAGLFVVFANLPK